MKGKRHIDSLWLQNILSYGPEGVALALEPLNVLIGANTSGKSNLLEALKLLKSTAGDLNAPIIEGGGIDEWIWQGAVADDSTGLEVVLPYPSGGVLLTYELGLRSVGQRMQVDYEVIKGDLQANRPASETLPPYFYQNRHGEVEIQTPRPLWGQTLYLSMLEWMPGELRPGEIKPDQSILSQRNDPNFYPVLHRLAQSFGDIQIYAEANIGRSSVMRKPQSVALPQYPLHPDGSNLALVLNDIQNRPGGLKTILEWLRRFYGDAENIIPRVIGNTIMVYIEEKGLRRTVPATRLSDGTLRFMFLVTLLCHPEPPPLIAIEEPELGMHPDIIPTIAELLIEALQRTQLVVTTHSDLLISHLRDVPEAICVCDRTPHGTLIRRLVPQELEIWLQNYSLGDVWLKGAIGGTRW